MSDNPTISRITLPSGNTYDLKDAKAREDIEALQSAVAGGITFVGVTTTAISDGSTTSSITVNNATHAATKGDLVFYGDKEFVWDGTKWIEFGDLGTLGALAYKNSASGSYTPAGSVSKPTFTGDSMTSTGSFTPAGSVTVSTNSTANKTATVSAASSGTATYTPAGSVSQPTFTGSSTSVSVTGTPAGTVSKPNITVTPSTTTVNSITNVGSLPSWSGTVSNETLTVTWNAGALPTKGNNQSVMTGASAALAAAPTFTGEEATFTGSCTPSGSVSKPTFTGSGVRLVTGNIAVPSSYTASFSGTAGEVSVSGTPTGSVSKPSFSGTAATIEVS
jgi:hypothetical protein